MRRTRALVALLALAGPGLAQEDRRQQLEQLWGAAVEGPPPAAFVDAEAAADLLFGALGLPVDRVEVSYRERGPLGRRISGQLVEADADGRAVIFISVQDPSRSAGTIFHEMWHYLQSQLYAGEEDPCRCELGLPFGCAYHDAGSYDANGFEREAFLFRDAMEPLFEVRYDKRARQHTFRLKAPDTFERDALVALARLVPELRDLWRGSEVRPTHLDELQRRLIAHDPMLAVQIITSQLLHDLRALLGWRRGPTPPRAGLDVLRQAIRAAQSGVRGGSSAGGEREGIERRFRDFFRD